jgi:hypothetical protein
MWATSSSEIYVDFQQTTPLYIPEAGILHNQRYDRAGEDQQQIDRPTDPSVRREDGSEATTSL